MPDVCIGDAGNGEVDAGQHRIRILQVSGGGVGGHNMRSHDGGIEGQLALHMAIVALVIIRLRAARVVDSSREIDVVVAGAACGPSGLAEKSRGLRGTGSLAVVNLAAANIDRSTTVQTRDGFRIDASAGNVSSNHGRKNSAVILDQSAPGL